MNSFSSETINRQSFLTPLAILAGRRETFRRSLPGLLRSAIGNAQTFPAVYRLARTAPFNDVVFSNPRFVLRYLTANYLARSFSVAVSAQCFLHHQTRMQTALTKRLMRSIALGAVDVWRLSNDEHVFSVAVGQAVAPHDKEGEWDLSLRVDGEPVYLLSFSVVPGSVVGSGAAEVALISRFQGVKGRYPDVKIARKALADVAPNGLLLAALQGFLAAIGVDELASVTASNQSMYCEEMAVSLHKAYDEFLPELGIGLNDAGFFWSRVPLQEKPMSEIKAGHKIRTRNKRELKAQVAAACQEFFQADIAAKQA